MKKILQAVRRFLSARGNEAALPAPTSEYRAEVRLLCPKPKECAIARGHYNLLRYAHRHGNSMLFRAACRDYANHVRFAVG